MTASFPLQPLLVARRARRDRTVREVRQRQIVVQTCEAERDAAHQRLTAAIDERIRQKRRLIENALILAGASPTELARAEQRLALLATRAEQLNEELSAAEQRLAEAKSQWRAAVAAFRQAQAKVDALLEQQTRWRAGLAHDAARNEEKLVEDLSVHRYAARR
jgi:chromosome segregation ATPase